MPECQGGGEPCWQLAILARAINPGGLGTESPQSVHGAGQSQVSLRGAGGRFGAPTSWAALEDVTVVKYAVEHGGNRRYITQ